MGVECAGFAHLLDVRTKLFVHALFVSAKPEFPLRQHVGIYMPIDPHSLHFKAQRRTQGEQAKQANVFRARNGQRAVLAFLDHVVSLCCLLWVRSHFPIVTYSFVCVNEKTMPGENIFRPG